MWDRVGNVCLSVCLCLCLTLAVTVTFLLCVNVDAIVTSYAIESERMAMTEEMMDDALAGAV